MEQEIKDLLKEVVGVLNEPTLDIRNNDVANNAVRLKKKLSEVIKKYDTPIEKGET